jgi:hypothetical protein
VANLLFEHGKALKQDLFSFYEVYQEPVGESQISFFLDEAIDNESLFFNQYLIFFDFASYDVDLFSYAAVFVFFFYEQAKKDAADIRMFLHQEARIKIVDIVLVSLLLRTHHALSLSLYERGLASENSSNTASQNPLYIKIAEV